MAVLAQSLSLSKQGQHSSNLKTKPASEFLSHPGSFFQVPDPVLKFWKSGAHAVITLKDTVPASAERCSETLSTSYSGQFMFCHRISSFEFQLVFSFLLRKARITTVSRFFECTSRFNLQRAKRPTHLSPKTVISLELRSFVSALQVKGTVN